MEISVDTQICHKIFIFINEHCTNKFVSNLILKPKPNVKKIQKEANKQRRIFIFIYSKRDDKISFVILHLERNKNKYKFQHLSHNF